MREPKFAIHDQVIVRLDYEYRRVGIPDICDLDGLEGMIITEAQPTARDGGPYEYQLDISEGWWVVEG